MTTKPTSVAGWAAKGFAPGAVVRQEIAPGEYDYAVINHVYEWGGLDVLLRGCSYGWSATVCQLVRTVNGEYILNQGG